MKYSLLMTACIEPTEINSKSISRSDPKLRLGDYAAALRFWLNYKDERITNIIFVENSGYDLTVLKKIANDENKYNRIVEFIQFLASPIPKGIHYGYSELEILDKAFDQSASIKETDFFIKVTGRLHFPKLNKLLDTILDTNLITIEFKDYRLFNFEQHYAVTTLIVIQKDFFKTSLYGLKDSMIEGKTSLFETCYYEFLKPLEIINKNIVTSFPIIINPVGVGAHWNVNYNSFKSKTFSFIRYLCKVIYPSFKI